MSDAVAQEILDALPDARAVNLLSVYDEVEAAPDRFVEAVKQLYAQGEIFYPKRLHIERIDGGGS